MFVTHAADSHYVAAVLGLCGDQWTRDGKRLPEQHRQRHRRRQLGLKYSDELNAVSAEERWTRNMVLQNNQTL